MAVLYRHHVKGMNASLYDQVSPNLIEKLKRHPGFVYHVAFATPEGFTVSEIWESREQHDDWFDNNVRGNVPAEIQVEAIDIHNIVTP